MLARSLKRRSELWSGSSRSCVGPVVGKLFNEDRLLSRLSSWLNFTASAAGQCSRKRRTRALNLTAMKMAPEAWLRFGVGSGGQLVDVDRIAEALKAAHEVVFDAGFVEAIEVVLAELLVALSCFEDVVGADEELVCDGDVGAFLPLSSLWAAVLVFEVGALGVSGGEGGFDQDGLEMDVAFANRLSSALVGAAVVAGTQARPGRQMLGTLEDGHVCAYLGNDGGRDGILDAGNPHQALDGFAIGRQALINARLNLMDLRIQMIQHVEVNLE